MAREGAPLSTRRPFNPTGGVLRSDKWGDGKFGASRGAARLHAGIDICGNPGSYVSSPVDGFVVRTGMPYSNDNGPWNCYLLIREEDGTEWRLFYVIPLGGIVGTTVHRGQAVATLADVGAKYGTHPIKKRMSPHTHIECWVNGTRIDSNIDC